jgi:predicted cupin superfamily sugar epimerase
MTSASNVLMVCCVSPSYQYFDHSLAALKFCGKIRDCIVKKLQQKEGGLYATARSSKESNVYGSTTGKQSSFDTTKEVIDHIKEEIAQ